MAQRKQAGHDDEGSQAPGSRLRSQLRRWGLGEKHMSSDPEPLHTLGPQGRTVWDGCCEGFCLTSQGKLNIHTCVQILLNISTQRYLTMHGAASSHQPASSRRPRGHRTSSKERSYSRLSGPPHTTSSRMAPPVQQAELITIPKTSLAPSTSRPLPHIASASHT